MVDVKDLSFSYGDHPVLEGVSFHLNEGELVAVLGANGAGKSTMFRCLLGLLKGFDGDVEIGGKSILQMSRKDLAKCVAYIPQAESCVFNYTVSDTVLMVAAGTLSPLTAPGKEQLETAEQAMENLGISHLAQRGVQEISGGERQLAMLARALAQKTKLLVMDEPTANLDYGNQQMVLRHVKQLAKEGYSILMSTHNPEQALQYATKVLILKDRKLFAFGNADEVLTEESIYQIYGLKVVIAKTVIAGTEVRSCIPVP